MKNKFSIIKHFVAAVLSLVLVFGALSLLAPEGVVITASAVGYGEGGFTAFGEGDNIRVFNLNREGKSNREAVYQLSASGEWTPLYSDGVVWDGEGDNTFRGVYPVAASYNGFVIPTDQSSDLDLADWMTDEYTADGADNCVNLDFKHRLAKVTAVITAWNAEFDGSDKVITDAMICSKGAAVDISYGTGTDGADAYTTDGIHTPIYPLFSDNAYTAIVAPVRYDAEDIFMSFTVDGRELTVLARSSELTNGLEAGKHYTFNLTVGKSGVEISSISVGGWTERVIESVAAVECLHESIVSGKCAQCAKKFFDYDAATHTATVYTAEELYAWNKAARNDLTLNLSIMQDVALTGENNWTPLGSDGQSYVGTVNGNNKTVSGLHIDRPDKNRQGFIGSAGEGGAVKNLIFEDVFVSGAGYSGIVVGSNGGIIENCHVISGTVTANGNTVAAIAGASSGATALIQGCTNAATVTAAGNFYEIGGISGRTMNSMVINCVNSGQVTGYGSVGGVVGSNGGNIFACYNEAEVTATKENSSVGGVAGLNSQGFANIYSSWTVDTNESDSSGNGVGGESYGVINACYSLAAKDADGVASAIEAMNFAIDTWNGNNPGKPCKYVWVLGDTGYPVQIGAE